MVKSKRFRIGRHADNDLTLLEAGLSAFHAEVCYREDGWHVVDLASTNGTFLNGNRIKRAAPICEGDTLQLASVGFRISAGSGAHEDPAPTRRLESPTIKAALELARVLSNQSVAPHFQPLVELATGVTVGWEGLARPQTESGTGPAELLEVASGYNQAGILSDVFARAAAECVGCRHCWPQEKKQLLFLNAHPQQIIEGSLPALLVEPALTAISESYRLVVEIPESLACEEAQMATWVDTLRQHGVLVAYDDFGKGQSRLTELLSVPPDFIKLDRALVADLDGQGAKRGLVRALVEACTSLNVRTIAEGIETQAELKACQDLGVNIGQGFLLARPATAYALFDTSTSTLPEHCPYVRLKLV